MRIDGGIFAERFDARMNFRQPDRKILSYPRRIAHANCRGLAVVLDKLGVVALLGELPAHLFELVVAGFLPRRRAMEHDDRGMRSTSARGTMILGNRLARVDELRSEE